MDGDREEEICEVVALKSSRADCSDLMAGYERARITLTKKNGLASIARYPNPLGFMIKEALPNCIVILAEMGLVPLDLWKIISAFAYINLLWHVLYWQPLHFILKETFDIDMD